MSHMQCILGSMHSFTRFPLHCQMVSGKGFEVPRRIYVDFDGITFRRKFLMGLEPEAIRMTIGATLKGLYGLSAIQCLMCV